MKKFIVAVALVAFTAAFAVAQAPSRKISVTGGVIDAQMVEPAIVEVALNTDAGPVVLRMNAFQAEQMATALAKLVR